MEKMELIKPDYRNREKEGTDLEESESRDGLSLLFGFPFVFFQRLREREERLIWS